MKPAGCSPSVRSRGTLPPMILLAFLTGRFLLRLALLAVLVVASTALATAPAIGGESWGALALGVVFGIGVWWVAVFDVPEWADGQR